MIWKFNSLVVPTWSNGAVVWGDQDFNGKIESGLRRLHRLAATRVAPMRKGTVTAGLEVILNLKPLTLIMKKRGLAFFITLSKHR